MGNIFNVKTMPNKPTRRSFLATSAAASAAFSAPFILPSHIWAAETKPNDRITMAFVGMGKQNMSLLRNFMYRDVQVVGVCDVDETRMKAAEKRANDYYTENPERGSADVIATKTYEDLMSNKDIDTVCIATPDHWHAHITLAALKAGKDVYCEKPLTHKIEESRLVIEAVEKYDRVLQTGSMQRSWKEFWLACELVRNGVIGDVKNVTVNFGGPGKPCDLEGEDMEPGLDWNRWLGPAPQRAYSSVLSPRGMHNHYPQWRRYREYGGGGVTDIGAHHVDIAHWGLGLDESGPIKVIPPKDAKASKGAQLVFANDVTITHANGFQIEFPGTEGRIGVGRRQFQLDLGGETVRKFTKREDGGSLESTLILTEREYLKEDRDVKLYKSRDHLDDFIACVKSRQKPITHEGIGARSAIACSLLNLAYYHGETLDWDPVKMTYAEGSSGEKEWLTGTYREPFAL